MILNEHKRLSVKNAGVKMKQHPVFYSNLTMSEFTECHLTGSKPIQ